MQNCAFATFPHQWKFLLKTPLIDFQQGANCIQDSVFQSALLSFAFADSQDPLSQVFWLLLSEYSMDKEGSQQTYSFCWWPETLKLSSGKGQLCNVCSCFQISAKNSSFHRLIFSGCFVSSCLLGLPSFWSDSRWSLACTTIYLIVTIDSCLEHYTCNIDF